ncbi:MAG: autotransporter outer membrane beta-barrel domain-containing protein [Pseudomonadota bacterium]
MMRAKHGIALVLGAIFLLPGAGMAQLTQTQLEDALGAEMNSLTRLGQQSRGVMDIGGSGIGPGFGRGGLTIRLDQGLFSDEIRPGLSGPTIWTGGDITVIDADDGREGNIGGVTAGVAFRPSDRFAATVFGSFRRDNLDSDQIALETDVSMFGGGLLVDYLAPGDVRAQAALRFGFGTGETTIGAVTGDFDQRELEFGLKVDRRFGFGDGFYADPGLEFSYQLSDRDDHTLSNGLQIPGEVTDTAEIRLGGALGQAAQFGGVLRQLDWELRGSAIVTFLGDTPATVFIADDETEFGGTVGGTLRFTFDNAVAIGVNADYLHLGGDLNAVSAGVDLEVPLN